MKIQLKTSMLSNNTNDDILLILLNIDIFRYKFVQVKYIYNSVFYMLNVKILI